MSKIEKEVLMKCGDCGKRLTTLVELTTMSLMGKTRYKIQCKCGGSSFYSPWFNNRVAIENTDLKFVGMNESKTASGTDIILTDK